MELRWSNINSLPDLSLMHNENSMSAKVAVIERLISQIVVTIGKA
jgi:hypothetical protein